ncbi:MAG: hypothetical protein WC373_05230 [Smithella sp.]|jgi:hypothetical protein
MKMIILNDENMTDNEALLFNQHLNEIEKIFKSNDPVKPVIPLQKNGDVYQLKEGELRMVIDNERYTGIIYVTTKNKQYKPGQFISFSDSVVLTRQGKLVGITEYIYNHPTYKFLFNIYDIQK